MRCSINASRPVSRVLYGRGSSPRRDGHSSGTPVTGRLARSTRAAARKRLIAETIAPPLFDLAPGGVYLADAVTGGAVRSYRTLSPLPPGSALRLKPGFGGLLSVALSLGSPPPGVTRHRLSVEPGLSSRVRLRRARPSDHPAA